MTTLATSAKVFILGIPPNWSQHRGSSLARDLAKASWRDLAMVLALSARAEAHWPIPVKCDPPALRWLEVAIYKRPPLYDDDGAVSCLKPLIDGCFRGQRRPPGPLAWDDGPDWLALITPPTAMQHAVLKGHKEGVVLTVHLVDPRSAEAAV